MCDEGRTGLANTVGKREAKPWLEELFNVRPTDILRLFNLHNAKNLQEVWSLPKQANPSTHKKKYIRGLTGNEHGGEPPCPDKETSRHPRV
jgi:hypothetical protein